MNFADLMEKASLAVKLFAELRETYERVKDTLSTDEQAELNARLADIHAENLALSATLDAALKAAERK